MKNESPSPEHTGIIATVVQIVSTEISLVCLAADKARKVPVMLIKENAGHLKCRKLEARSTGFRMAIDRRIFYIYRARNGFVKTDLEDFT